MSLSIRSIRRPPRNGATRGPGEVVEPASATSARTGGSATDLDTDRGALRRISLRFLDAEMEREYQRHGGAESLTGFRISTAVAAVMWFLAAVIIPAGTPIPPDRAVPLSYAMALLNTAVFMFSVRADTLDRQHFTVSVLTTVNALVILWLASTGGVLPGYGISAVMLLFAFGFVARTAFIYAAWRSVVIVFGFGLAAIAYRGSDSLVVDAFIFGAAVIGTLLALRMLERSRRRVFYQDMVITRQADALRLEKDRGDALLRNMLPGSISSRLLAGERTIADEYPAVTVLFADIVGFTRLTGRVAADDLVEMLGRLFARFDELVTERGLEKIKTIGDAYMVAGGLPEPLEDHAARVVDLGLAMLDVAAQEGTPIGDLRLRIGVHSGSVIGGVIGDRKFAFDIWGETVNVASRLESQGIPDQVVVSAATWRNIEGLFDGEARGSIDLRGYGPIDAYTIVRRRPRAEDEPQRGIPRAVTTPNSIERKGPVVVAPLAIPGGA